MDNSNVKRSPSPNSAAFGFSLATLFIVVTLISLGMGLFAVEPWLGIVYAGVAIPTFVRGTLVIRRRQARDERVGIGEKFDAMAHAFGIMMLTVIVPWLTSAAVMMMSELFRPMGQGLFRIFGLLSILTFVATLIGLIRCLWPIRDD
jgi:predicted anti-sigma-YlaC factor YlaD